MQAEARVLDVSCFQHLDLKPAETTRTKRTSLLFEYSTKRRVDVVPGLSSNMQDLNAHAAPVGLRPIMVAGLACAFAVLGLLGSYTDASSIAAASNELPPITKWIARIVSCCIYAGAVFFWNDLSAVFRKAPRIIAMGLALTLGIALSFAGSTSVFMFALGQALVGATQPIALLCWADRLAGIERRERGLTVISAGIAAALVVLAYKLSPPLLAAGIFLTVAVASVALLAFIYDGEGGGVRTEMHGDRQHQAGMFGVTWELLLLMACYSFLFRAMQGFDFELPVVTPIVRCAVSIAALAALGAYIRRTQRTRANLFGPLFMLVAAALVLVPFSSTELRAAANGVANSCWSLFYYLLWLVLFDSGDEAADAPFKTFAVGWFALNVCLVILAPLAALLTSQIDQGMLSVTALVAMLVYTLLVASMLTRNASARRSGATQGGAVDGSLLAQVDACERLATESGLTPRETEVLSLLARGRSVPFIAEELSISQSTAKGHVQHIYAKTGVSTKQELLTLLGQ